MSFPNSGSCAYPLVVGFHQLGEVVVGDEFLRQRLPDAGNFRPFGRKRRRLRRLTPRNSRCFIRFFFRFVFVFLLLLFRALLVVVLASSSRLPSVGSSSSSSLSLLCIAFYLFSLRRRRINTHTRSFSLSFNLSLSKLSFDFFTSRTCYLRCGKRVKRFPDKKTRAKTKEKEMDKIGFIPNYLLQIFF